MSRNSSRHSKGGPSSAQPLSFLTKFEPDKRYWAMKFLEHVATIRAHVAPRVIADGVNGGDDWVWPVVEFLGDMELFNQLQALDDRLHNDGINTDVPNPLDIDPEHRESLTDAVVTLGISFGRAGYLLGLAVGTQLGPDALTGGAR